MGVVKQANLGTEFEQKSQPMKAPVKPRKVDLKKADKRRRILEAAASTFEKNGYEGATVRQIAKEAGVAIGTVSLYAEDKWTLALMAFDEKLDSLSATALARIEEDKPILDNLTNFTEGFFKAFADQPHLTHVFMRMNFFSAEGQNELMIKHFDTLTAAIGKAYDVGYDRQDILPDTPRETFVMLTFHVFIGALRTWIATGSGTGAATSGVKEMRRLFDLQLKGVSA